MYFEASLLRTLLLFSKGVDGRNLKTLFPRPYPFSYLVDIFFLRLGGGVVPLPPLRIKDEALKYLGANLKQKIEGEVKTKEKE